MVGSRTIGIIIIAATLLVFIIGLIYVKQAEAYLISQARMGENGECVHYGTVCPYEQVNKLSAPKYIASSVLLGIFAVGAYLVFKPKAMDAKMAKAKKATRGLGGEEKKIMDLVLQSEGMIFQNELVEKSQLSKVRITRILDRLEAKGLVERRRRGMTNVVILKN